MHRLGGHTHWARHPLGTFVPATLTWWVWAARARPGAPPLTLRPGALTRALLGSSWESAVGAPQQTAVGTAVGPSRWAGGVTQRPLGKLTLREHLLYLQRAQKAPVAGSRALYASGKQVGKLRELCWALSINISAHDAWLGVLRARVSSGGPSGATAPAGLCGVPTGSSPGLTMGWHQALCPHPGAPLGPGAQKHLNLHSAPGQEGPAPRPR